MGYGWFFAVVIGILIYVLFREQNKLKVTIQTLQITIIKLEKLLHRDSPAFDEPPATTETLSPETPHPTPKKSPQAKSETLKPAPFKTEATKPQQATLKELEESLSSKWMLWVGGLAMALGGGFLVKYSIDVGLLSPLVRVSLGFIMGVILTLGGELLRQRRLTLDWLQGKPDYLPNAISAAGLFSAFAAIYAAYALYEFLPPLMAFIALALLCFVASGLAYYQGRFFAYLGLIGGILVPLLVTTGPPSAWGLFPYLLVIIAASLWVSRQKSWRDVAATTLLLALVWAIVWIPTNWADGDIIPIGLYLLILGGLNGILLSGASPSRAKEASLKAMITGNGITVISDLVMLCIVILIISITRIDHYNLTGFTLIAVGLLAQGYAIHRSPSNDMGGMISLFGVIFLFATWHIPNLLTFQTTLTEFEQLRMAWDPTYPPDLEKFLIAVLTFTALTGASVFFRLPHLLRKNVWASIGNILPIILLIITYHRVADWGTSLTFAFVALLLACFCALAVTRLTARNQARNREDWIIPIAAYAAGATTAISLGIAMTLRDAWLTFSLALQLAALAHIWRATAVKGLRTLALLLAVIILARLLFNGEIFDYHNRYSLPAFNWLFYGYGLTAALFAYAARTFTQNGPEDRLLSVLKSGAILLTIAFITLELRVLFSDGNGLLSQTTVLETALQGVNWAAATTILFWYEVKNNDIVFGRLRRFMTLITLIGLTIGGGILNNIFVMPVDVGDTPIFNLQFVQFFIPGLLYGAKAYIAHRAKKPRSLKIYGGLAFIIILFWCSAEVHNGFHPYVAGYQYSNWEAYSYSAVWLVYAIIVLIAGLKWHQPQIRKAGLAVLGIVVLKVFLVDMSQLEGLARALSFIGLGGALVGLGYLYQKLNRPDTPPLTG